jgi:hypothetical protein
MVTIEVARQLALALPETEEKPHFDLPSFRVKDKIFATIHTKNNRAMVKLSLVDQSVFCAVDKAIIYSVPGGWGAKGATFVELSAVKRSILKDALLHAWLNVAPAKLAGKYNLGAQ